MKLRKYQRLHGFTNSELARHLGITRQRSSEFLLGKRKVSPRLARQIEARTHGAVTRYELRPDVFGRKPRAGAAASMPQNVSTVVTDRQPEQTAPALLAGEGR